MIPNPWVLLGLALGWFASLAGVGIWQNHAGHNAERVAWQQRELDSQAAADAKYKQLEAKYRALEQGGAQQLADVSADYQEKLKNAESKNADLIAKLRTGAVRLRDPNASAASSCVSGMPATPSGAGGRDGGTTAGLPDASAGILSDAASQFLIELTGKANTIVEQLAACQQIVRTDRQIINGKYGGV